MGMEHLLHEAKEYEEEESLDYRPPKIIVVGCGGAGSNSVNRLMHIGVNGARTFAINTDKLHLDRIRADQKLLIGRSVTRGMGSGGLPEVGLRCAELAEDKLREIVAGADLVFITVGMGGGTGTGLAPFVAQLARRSGSVVVAIATAPFTVERSRIAKAKVGLQRLRRSADSVIVLDNNKLLEIVPNLPVEQAFSVMDQLISEVIKGLTETITMPSLINLDFADMRAIMCTGGTSTMLYGENAADDPDMVVLETLHNPLLDIDFEGANGALIHVTSGPGLSLRTAHEVIRGITNSLSDDANVIFGARVDKEYEGVIKVMTIITGVKSPNLLSPAVGLVEHEVHEEMVGIPLVR
ncbi:MAG: cell division protein FtsZ [Methanobacteriota archaeon]|nr:MAG: cell division protein FtsZ [Euryarchaeota archaeon]